METMKERKEVVQVWLESWLLGIVHGGGLVILCVFFFIYIVE